MPVATYSHADGCSITGGYVYRGSNASLRGRYIYGDYCSGTIWSFKIAGGKASDSAGRSSRSTASRSFGRGQRQVSSTRVSHGARSTA